MINEQPTAKDFDSTIKQLHRHYQSQANYILNYLPKLSQTLNELEQYDDVDILNKISNHCYRMMRTTTNFETYFKLIDSPSPLHPTKVPINGFLNDLLTSAKLLLAKTEFILEYDICKEQICAEVDQHYLSTAILHLISNSCTFSPKNSTIKVTIFANNNTISIIVKDEGNGIPKDKLELIFAPFYSQGNDTHSQSTEGIGLGLPIVKQIATLMNGSILVAAGDRGGTVVTFSFPIVNNNPTTLTVSSGAPGYVSARFSPLYLLLSEICDVVFY